MPPRLGSTFDAFNIENCLSQDSCHWGTRAIHTEERKPTACQVSCEMAFLCSLFGGHPMQIDFSRMRGFYKPENEMWLSWFTSQSPTQMSHPLSLLLRCWCVGEAWFMLWSLLLRVTEADSVVASRGLSGNWQCLTFSENQKQVQHGRENWGSRVLYKDDGIV